VLQQFFSSLSERPMLKKRLRRRIEARPGETQNVYFPFIQSFHYFQSSHQWPTNVVVDKTRFSGPIFYGVRGPRRQARGLAWP